MSDKKTAQSEFDETVTYMVHKQLKSIIVVVQLQDQNVSSELQETWQDVGVTWLNLN
jgi:hypothetical protein